MIYRRSKKDMRKIYITVRLSIEERKLLERLADESGLGVTQVARLLMFLNSPEKSQESLAKFQEKMMMEFL